MISFKEYLTEARMAPLYHATTINSLLSILSENKIRKSTLYREEKSAVSLTRDLRTAIAFAKAVHGNQDVIIIQLDQLKLAQNYKIEPYQFWSQPQRGHIRIDKTRVSKEDANLHRDEGIMNEFEERIVDRDIENAKKYITAFHVRKGILRKQSEEVKNILKDVGVPIRPL